MVYLRNKRRFSVLRYFWLLALAIVVLATAAFFMVHFTGYMKGLSPMPRDSKFWVGSLSAYMVLFSLSAAAAHRLYRGQNGAREWAFALLTVYMVATIVNILTWFW